MISLQDTDFKSLIAKETNGRMRIRLIALSHIQAGTNKTQTAKYLKVSRRIVNEWVAKFYAEGLDGLKEKPRPGRPTALTNAQIAQFKQYVLNNSIKAKGGRLKATDMAEYVNIEFGTKYSIQNIYLILHKLNFSWITSRSRHPKQSEEVQEAFKKIQNGNDPQDPMESRS
jgi:transposase